MRTSDSYELVSASTLWVAFATQLLDRVNQSTGLHLPFQTDSEKSYCGHHNHKRPVAVMPLQVPEVDHACPGNYAWAISALW